MRAAEIYDAFTFLKLRGSRVGWLYGKDSGSDLELIISLGLLGPHPVMSLEFSCMMSRMVLKPKIFFLFEYLFIYSIWFFRCYFFPQCKTQRPQMIGSAGIFPRCSPVEFPDIWGFFARSWLLRQSEVGLVSNTAVGLLLNYCWNRNLQAHIFSKFEPQTPQTFCQNTQSGFSPKNGTKTLGLMVKKNLVQSGRGMSHDK